MAGAQDVDALLAAGAAADDHPLLVSTPIVTALARIGPSIVLIQLCTVLVVLYN